jgi:hypothetical protein
MMKMDITKRRKMMLLVRGSYGKCYNMLSVKGYYT